VAPEARTQLSEKLLNFAPGSLPPGGVIQPEAAKTLALTGLVDLLVFFGVLLVAFAYVWKRGDLDWVRSLVDSSKRAAASRAGPTAGPAERRPLESVA
jgi:NADH-quinone oxidoreductase subunit A